MELPEATLLWLICECVTAAVTAFYLASFFQAFLHRVCGHHRAGGPLFRTHITSHHALYRPGRMTSDRYEDDEIILTPYYIVPYVALLAAAYPALHRLPFVVYVVSLTGTFWAHSYVHVQFHLTRSRYSRFRWFKRMRQIHFLHHSHADTNFGLISTFWDRLFGTFLDTGSRASEPGEERGADRASGASTFAVGTGSSPSAESARGGTGSESGVEGSAAR